jgi:uncharacterized protein YbaP (TraB family)
MKGARSSMKRFAGLVSAALLFVLTGCAGSPGPTLWRLTDSDSDITLFGTVHLLPPALKWRTPAIDKAFADAEIVYFETRTDAAAQSRIAELVKTLGENRPGVTLASQLGASDQGDLAAVCVRVKVDCAYLAKARPWLAAVQLSVAFVVSQGQAADAGVEHVLEAEAERSGKTRHYFETSEQQLKFFANLPPDVEIGFLRATLKEILQNSEDTDAMTKAWARGDTKTLAGYLDEMTKEAGPEIYAALIRDRNKAWAEEIDTMMKGKGKVFVAVGAAHLLGPDSVPALLRAKGYKVEGP